MLSSTSSSSKKRKLGQKIHTFLPAQSFVRPPPGDASASKLKQKKKQKKQKKKQKKTHTFLPAQSLPRRSSQGLSPGEAPPAPESKTSVLSSTGGVDFRNMPDLAWGFLFDFCDRNMQFSLLQTSRFFDELLVFVPAAYCGLGEHRTLHLSRLQSLYPASPGQASTSQEWVVTQRQRIAMQEEIIQQVDVGRRQLVVTLCRGDLNTVMSWYKDTLDQRSASSSSNEEDSDWDGDLLLSEVD